MLIRLMKVYMVSLLGPLDVSCFYRAMLLFIMFASVSIVEKDSDGIAWKLFVVLYADEG